MSNDEQLTVDLWILDAMLTGKDPRSGRGSEEKLVTCEKFFAGEMYYLSDGGYSRVNYREMGAALALTDNSRQEVKEQWDSHAVQVVRHRIERRIAEWLRE